jgi:nucleoid-associated protein YgaU
MSAAAEPKLSTKIVSRGDTLWRISRATYGDGMRYAVVYRANRERIRDPNRIYPGQIFVLPMKAH